MMQACLKTLILILMAVLAVLAGFCPEEGIHEQVAEFGNLAIVSVPTVNQLTDLGMKVLASPHFEYLV